MLSHLVPLPRTPSSLHLVPWARLISIQSPNTSQSQRTCPWLPLILSLLPRSLHLAAPAWASLLQHKSHRICIACIVAMCGPRCPVCCLACSVTKHYCWVKDGMILRHFPIASLEDFLSQYQLLSWGCGFDTDSVYMCIMCTLIYKTIPNYMAEWASV